MSGGKSSRPRGAWIAAAAAIGVLAAAGALVRRQSDPLTRIARLAGRSRPVEARLTGFLHAPFTPP
ncbi:MAG TPA: hypothetical protein VGS03_11275, partial [Candidatus Polarisedimenticolia bacterium]|nr:hypothetical protein [Candidatus Polarisedimenticolia bacterium]